MWQQIFSKSFVYPCIIIIIGGIVYFNALFNGFVWLDNQYVLNPSAAHTAQLTQIFNGSYLTGVGYYRPFNAIYYTILNIFFQNQPFYFHLIQISVHIFNAVLVFFIFQTFFKKRLSFFLSLLFLVHPVVQTIAVFVSNSADTLYMLFGLLAFFCVMRLKEMWWKVFSVSFFILISLFFKESGVLFIVLCLLYIFLYKREKISKYFLSFLITFLVYFSIRYFTHGFQFYQVDLYPIMRLNFVERLLNIPAILLFYIKSVLIPYDIGINHRWAYTTITFSNFYLPLCIDLFFFGCLAFGLFIWKQNSETRIKYLLFFSGFCIALLSIVQIIPLDYTVAARWFYFPFFCLLGIIGAFLNRISLNKNKMKLVLLCCCVVITILAGRTVIKNTFWKNDLTLFTHAAAIDDNFITEGWLANTYFQQGDYQKALQHIAISTAQFSYDNNLAIKALIYEKLGDEKTANTIYQYVLVANNYAPNQHDEYTYQLLIQHYLRIKEYTIAQNLLEKAVKEYPDDAYFWTILALLEYKKNNLQEALLDIQKAVLLDPQEPVVQTIYQNIINNQPFIFNIK